MEILFEPDKPTILENQGFTDFLIFHDAYDEYLKEILKLFNNSPRHVDYLKEHFRDADDFDKVQFYLETIKFDFDASPIYRVLNSDTDKGWFFWEGLAIKWDCREWKEMDKGAET